MARKKIIIEFPETGHTFALASDEELAEEWNALTDDQRAAIKALEAENGHGNCHVEDGCSECGAYVTFRGPFEKDDGRHQHYSADDKPTTDWIHAHADDPEALVGYEGCHPDLEHGYEQS